MIMNSSTPRALRLEPLHPNSTEKFLSPSPSVKFRRLSPSIVATHASGTCVSPPKLASSSLYEVLGIPMGATNQDIKAAYRMLARTCHPDTASFGRKDSSSDEFIKIHAAYSTLSDSEKRADYDRRIYRLQRPSGSYSGVSASSETVYSRFSGSTRQNWETDQCW